jgi:4-hydroxy-tetrahydrodipicolinate synthase
VWSWLWPRRREGRRPCWSIRQPRCAICLIATDGLSRSTLQWPASGYRLSFYLYEAAGGFSYSLDAVDELLDLAGVIGIKVATLDSVMTYQDVAARVRGHEGALLISGEDRFLGYSLMLGADAVLIGMAAACTDVSSALLDAWYSRDLPRFTALSAALDEFARVTFAQPMDCYIQRMLWALEADGVIPEGATDPFGPAAAGLEQAAVQRAVQALRRK